MSMTQTVEAARLVPVTWNPEREKPADAATWEAAIEWVYQGRHGRVRLTLQPNGAWRVNEACEARNSPWPAGEAGVSKAMASEVYEALRAVGCNVTRF